MKSDDLSIVIAGEAGQGLQSIESMLTAFAKKAFYNVFATKEYMSRVRGGCNSTAIRISPESVMAGVGRIDLLVPLDAEAILLIDVDGDPETVEKQAALVANFCKSQGARDVRVSQSEKENEQLWMARRSAFGAVARLRPTCVIEDATVPVSYLTSAIKKVVEQLNQGGDAKVHKFFSTPIVGMGCGSHPNVDQHALMADQLGRIIAGVIGW